MTYVLLSSRSSVQVLSPTLVVDTVSCTIQTGPSGVVATREVPLSEFTADQGEGILNSLAVAIEQVMSDGMVSGASGTQLIDDSGLILDAVSFVVTYQPPPPIPGPISVDVTIPVDVLTADTSFGSFLAGGSAADQISAAYQRLQAMAQG